MSTKKAVLDFLKIQNRPYNINDILSNLNEYSKSAIQKAVEELVEEECIMEKISSKQKIYCICQKTQQDTKELMRIDKELQAHANELEEKLQNLQKQIKKHEDILQEMKNHASIEELLVLKESLSLHIKELNKKLDNLMESSTRLPDLTFKKRKLEEELNTYQKEYNKRRRTCMDVIDCILENYPKSKQTFFDEVGIDVANA